MRHVITLFVLALMLTLPVLLFAQVPQSINYQAIVRGLDLEPILDQDVSLRLSFLENAPDGFADYIEVHQVRTNSFGLVNMQLGRGTPEQGLFTDINWENNDYFLKVELDPEGGNSFINMGTGQLISVPYALHAQTVDVDRVDDADNDPNNERITTFQRQGDNVILVEGGDEITIDLSDFRQELSKEGNQIVLSNGGGAVTDEVDDADSDPTNELQQLTFANNILGITNGNTVNLASISPWVTYNNGIYYDQGDVLVGNPVGIDRVKMDEFGVYASSNLITGELGAGELILWDNVDLRAKLSLGLLEFWNANGNYNAAIGSDPGWMGTFNDGVPASAIGVNSAGAGTLGLFDPAGVPNITLGTDPATPSTGSLALMHNGNARALLSTKPDDAGVLETYGPTGNLNTQTSFLSTKPDGGAFWAFSNGNLRAGLYTGNVNAGELLLFGSAGDTISHIRADKADPNAGILKLFSPGGSRVVLTAGVQDAGSLGLSGPTHITAGLSSSPGEPDHGILLLAGGGKTSVLTGSDPVRQGGFLATYDQNGDVTLDLGTDPINPFGGYLSISQQQETKATLSVHEADAGELLLFGPAGDTISHLRPDKVDPNAGQLSLFSLGGRRAFLTAGIDDAGALGLLGPTHPTVGLGSMPGAPDHGLLLIGGDGKEKLFAGSNPNIEGGFLHTFDFTGDLTLALGTDPDDILAGYLSLFRQDSRKATLSVHEDNAGELLLFGFSGDTVIHLRPPTGDPNAGGMGFYGPADEINIALAVTNTSPNVGSISTFEDGHPITMLANNPGHAGTFSTFSTDGYIKTMISTSSANEAGTFTTYHDGNPIIELNTNLDNSGYIKTYAFQKATGHLSSNGSGFGGLWLANQNDQWESILTSNNNPSNSGGQLELLKNGHRRIFASTFSDAGIVETFGPNGNLTNLMTYTNNDFNAGGMGSYYNGNPRATLNATSDFGVSATFGSNNLLNVNMTALVGHVDHGFISVNNAGGTALAGMYVNAAGQGIVWGTTKNFRMPHPDRADKEIWYASIEGPEAAAYIRGTGQLENGQATVQFPDHFRHVANPQTMTVMLTPLSAQSKGMAVIEKTSSGFIVQELWQGSGNYTFDWEVKCVRQGFEDYRVIRNYSEALPAETPVLAKPEPVETALPGDHQSSRVRKPNNFKYN